jgi:hypothetical protein
MTKNEMMELLNELERSGDVLITHMNGEIHIDIYDFVGFDDDWDEEYREFSKPELVKRLEEVFEELGDGDFYNSMELEGQTFVLGYTSYDI